MSRTLVTDLYELNMAASYLRRGMTSPATFSLFIRDLPEGWGFLVACGLERCLEYLEEPLLEVTAPLPEAQLVETYLLNQVTYQTAVASKAARCRIAAPDASMVDFSMRRVHGGEASLGVARATAIAGFRATSNVEAARILGLRA